MIRNAFLILLCLYFSSELFSQDLKFFHGRPDENLVFDSRSNTVIKPNIRKKQGEKFSIQILNPNPLFYTYEVQFQQQENKSEEKEITDLFAVFNTIIGSRFPTGPGGVRAATPALVLQIDEYKKALDTLSTDIEKAKQMLLNSDKPEIPNDALGQSRTGGLRAAIDQINNLPNSKFHFNNNTLLNDLNALSMVITTDIVLREALIQLNTSRVQKVNEIKKSIRPTSLKTVITNEFVVTEKPAKVILTIKRIDLLNENLVRYYQQSTTDTIELGTILPHFQRSTLELVPLANFVFADNVQEFYLENNLVQSRKKNTTTISPGIVLNINLPSFGSSKEFAVGIGPGYKFSSDAKVLENFYISSLLSYKNILRIGIGFGYAQFPYGLKEGGQIGKPLPANVSDLNNLIEYEEKPSVFLSIAFTGLNLTKKK